MSWLAELADRARSALPAPMWDYVETGAHDGISAAEAEAAWHDVRFAPRVMRNPGRVDCTTDLLGTQVVSPIGVAPTSLQRVAHPEGELAMARGTHWAGSLQVVSSNAGTRFAELAATGPWWLQAYLPPDRESMRPVLEAAAAAGAAAVVLTVDTPVPGTKRRPAEADWAGIDLSWFRCNFADPDTVRWAEDLSVADIGWVAAAVGLPVVVKGVLRADDARACVAGGAAAIWVSNHGGRQLDRTLSSRHALPGVAAAVGGTVPVYVDGGLRSGLDVLAALALGADATFLGRPTLWALAAGGAAGVRDLLTRLGGELAEALLLAGARTPADTREVAAPPPRFPL